MEHYVSFWKNTFNFSGKATRAQYWVPSLINFLIGAVLGAVSLNITSKGGDASTIVLIASIISFLTIIPGLSVSVRRMHDIGKSGFWVLIVFVPIIGAVWFLILTLIPSKNDDMNHYQSNDLEG